MDSLADKEGQIKNSALYLLPTVVSSVIPLISLPVFTRILSTEDFGLLALAQVFGIFVCGMANFGMTAAYDRNYFEYREKRRETGQLLYTCLLFVSANFVLLGCLSFLLREGLSKLITGSPGHGNLLVWALCGQFLYTFSYYYLTFFRNAEDARQFVVFTVAAALINLVLSIFFVALMNTGVLGILYAQVISGGAVFLVLTRQFSKTYRWSLSKKVFKETFRVAYPLTPRIFLGVVGKQFDKYMIGLLASVGGVGIYSIGQRISYAVFHFMTAIENVFSPQVYRRMFDMKDGGGRSIGAYLTPFCYVSIFPALLIVLFSFEAISILTPPSFHSAADIITALSLYYGILFFGKITGTQLIYAKKTYITSLLSMGHIGLNIALNIPFIHRWGAQGAAWATLLAGLVVIAVSFAVSQRYYRIWWEFRKLMGVYGVFFGASSFIILARYFSMEYAYQLVFKCVFLFFYGYLGKRMGIVTFGNLMLVKNMIHPGRAGISNHT